MYLRDEMYQNYFKNHNKLQFHKNKEYDYIDILFYGSCAIVFFAICEKIHPKQYRSSLTENDFNDYPYHGF
ncbi:hypothetical protein QJ850_gp064 [Acanthamoeba polyphaga mimivirus]|uniref:Uncharacterized protein n=1 Tax=Acanthamoeba polyphaga mimivirus Kroon TaxID=3069720 RepID=A0A0G2Y494_9VIRU|nr:hypothetical protein QJ850_gp064 [Acanthamoeba polyphaga mimivirus]AKI80635.1 hypothetical protein [Acanthamoeba polyphaga mimivirus Kroon]